MFLLLLSLLLSFVVEKKSIFGRNRNVLLELFMCELGDGGDE
jgi:hypothetical protein